MAPRRQPAARLAEDAMKLPATMRVFERGWLSSNNILFIDRERSALVDSGYVTHAPQTLQLVGHALGGRKLDWLVNTHLHSDHCGGNAALQRSYACRTSIPASEADHVRRWDEGALSYKATGQRCERFSFDDGLRPGELLVLGGMHWQALAAPGHDPHSLVLFCPDERILISADALWENGFGVIFPELEGESGFAETRATLDMIAGLDAKLVIPGHGKPFTDVGKALDTAYSRLEYLSADPVRNAQHALKVLLKFLLLEKRSMPLAEVPALLNTIRLFSVTNRLFLRQPEDVLARWLAEQLVRVGAAEIAGDQLLDRG
jgi:glyoxylase-like metal-dependent hydrolase (beta-lactamase superfamily II)